MNGVLRDWVRGFRADTEELDEWKQKLVVAKADRQNDRVPVIERNIRDTNDRLHDNYQAILRSLRPQMEAKARQSGFVGENGNLFDDVLGKCLLKIDPDTEGLAAYILTTCANEIVNEFRRRKTCVALPAVAASGDGGDDEESQPKRRPRTNEPVTEAGHPSVDQEQLKAQDPEAYRRQQVERLVIEYALRKRTLIDGLKFSSAAHVATLLTDQRQRTAKLLAQSDYARVEITTQTEWRELWSDEDPQRDMDTGIREPSAAKSPTLAKVWKALSGRIRDSLQDIGQQMVADAIGDCGGAVSHQAWRQRRRRYRAELTSQLDPQELKYFP